MLTTLTKQSLCLYRIAIALILVLFCAACAQTRPDPGVAQSSRNPYKQSASDTYSHEEITKAANDFFGETTEGLAKTIEKSFSDLGRPNAYIKGQEGSGAVVLGLRYGGGYLYMKRGSNKRVFWQGPSVGFDFGGTASKVFILIYNLPNSSAIYKRFPGVAGSIYVVAGVGVNYLRGDGITLAPIRTGVGFRAGVNVGYLHFTREKTLNPL